MTQPNNNIRTLEEIVMRKEYVLGEVHRDDEKIKKLWGSLFHAPNLTSSTPSKRITGFMNAGVGVFDGLLLAWKLYRKFKKK